MLETIETIVFAIKLYRKYSSSLFQQRSCSESSDSQNGGKSWAIWAGVINSQEFPEQIPEPLTLNKVRKFPASLNILSPNILRLRRLQIFQPSRTNPGFQFGKVSQAVSYDRSTFLWIKASPRLYSKIPCISSTHFSGKKKSHRVSERPSGSEAWKQMHQSSSHMKHEYSIALLETVETCQAPFGGQKPSASKCWTQNRTNHNKPFCRSKSKLRCKTKIISQKHHLRLSQQTLQSHGISCVESVSLYCEGSRKGVESSSC